MLSSTEMSVNQEQAKIFTVKYDTTRKIHYLNYN